ncbi:hypothetical protein GCM10019059_39070 [Camelimonas fluminis]|uniref:N-acetyltransferase domain-containing protein n=1 Tax=Camelimonas fluminis TaxID=1576911 RepID=A0ABV7UHY7_9HYPH|nr:hypothetical protein [Camelimonas fluminis]GHE75912.1 hypothetical protein GCM10019059_39070 [Camelimonas fluminis]
MASIQLVHIPIQGGWTGATHQFLLFTRDNGAMEFIRGGPERQPKFDQLVRQSASGPQNPFGSIVVHAGPYDARTPDFPVRETQFGAVFDKRRFDNWVKIDIRQGKEQDLQETWTAMTMTARGIGKRSIPYCPLGQNSNSVASECLRRHGFAHEGVTGIVPWGHKIGLRPWSPGSNNRLPDDTQLPPDHPALKAAHKQAEPLALTLAALQAAGRLGLHTTSSLTPQHKPCRRLEAGLGD